MANITTLTFKCPYLHNRHNSDSPSEALVNIANGVPVGIICANIKCPGECAYRVERVDADLRKYTDPNHPEYSEVYAGVEKQYERIPKAMKRGIKQSIVTAMQELHAQEKIKTQPQRKCIVAEGFRRLEQ